MAKKPLVRPIQEELAAVAPSAEILARYQGDWFADRKLKPPAKERDVRETQSRKCRPPSRVKKRSSVAALTGRKIRKQREDE